MPRDTDRFHPWSSTFLKQARIPQFHSRAQGKHALYFLVCPISQTIRYVGVTNDPARRAVEHAEGQQANARCRRWVAGLIAIGRVPELVVIGRVAPTQWETGERAWIRWFRKNGWCLYNIHRGGLLTAEELARAKGEPPPKPTHRLKGQIDASGRYVRDVPVPLTKQQKHDRRVAKMERLKRKRARQREAAQSQEQATRGERFPAKRVRLFKPERGWLPGS